jgi:hypothetical protein
MAFSVQKLRDTLDGFIAQDDGKLDTAEMMALFDLGRTNEGPLLAEAVGVLADVYKEGEDLFESPFAYRWMRDTLLAGGASPKQLGLPATTPELEAFQALSPEDKLAFLYEGYDASTGTLTLNRGITHANIRFENALEGPAYDRAMNAYNAAKAELAELGGGYPAARALMKDGQIFAWSVELESDERFEKTRVFDADFQQFHEYVFTK